MKPNLLRASGLTAIILFTCLFPACGSDGGGGTSGPGNGTSLKNPIAVGFQAIGDAVEASIAANSSIYASLEFFVPHIGSTFITARSSERVSGTAAASCLPPALQGKLFTWNEGLQQYTSEDDPSLDGSARYDLYEVDATGTPTSSPPTMIGYFQVDCNGQLPLDTLIATVNLNGVPILDMELRSMLVYLPNFIFGASDITLRDPNGDDVLALVVAAEGTPGDYLDHILEVGPGLDAFDARLAGFRATVGLEDHSLNADGLPEPPIDYVGAGANQFNDSQTLLWNAGVIMHVDEYGVISNIIGGFRAPLEFENRQVQPSTNGIYACFSGQHDAPLVEYSATGDGCATGVIENPLALTASELAALRVGYEALYRMLEIAGPMWVIAMELMTP